MRASIRARARWVQESETTREVCSPTDRSARKTGKNDGRAALFAQHARFADQPETYSSYVLRSQAHRRER